MPNTGLLIQVCTYTFTFHKLLNFCILHFCLFFIIQFSASINLINAANLHDKLLKSMILTSTVSSHTVQLFAQELTFISFPSLSTFPHTLSSLLMPLHCSRHPFHHTLPTRTIHATLNNYILSLVLLTGRFWRLCLLLPASRQFLVASIEAALQPLFKYAL